MCFASWRAYCSRLLLVLQLLTSQAAGTVLFAAKLTRAVLASLLVVGARFQAIPRQMTIAAVFDEGGDPKHELAFHHAVQSINRNR